MDTFRSLLLVLSFITVFTFCFSLTVNGQRNNGNYISPIQGKEQPAVKQKIKKERQKNEFGYMLFLEGGMGGINTENFNIDSAFASFYFSNGVHFKNAYLGIGTGYDHNNDQVASIPLMLDLRFCFTDNRYNSPKPSLKERNGLNAFIFLSAGYAFIQQANTPLEDNKKLTYQGGMGLLFGKLDDVRMTLELGYKYQEFPDMIDMGKGLNREGLFLRIGVEFNP